MLLVLCHLICYIRLVVTMNFITKQTIVTLLITNKHHNYYFTTKHFLFVYKKRSRRKQKKQAKIKQINIYIHLILIIIIIITIILWESFPACVCCPGADGVCPWGKQELVKTFTAWKILGAVSKAERYWGIFSLKNNGIEPDGNI